MADAKMPEKVLKVQTDSSKSAKDLEAEIAAAASAISGMETVDGETMVKEVKKKTRSASKKIPKKATKSKAKTNKAPAKSDSKPKATVKITTKTTASPVKKKTATKKPRTIKVMATSDVKPRSHKSVKKTAKQATVEMPTNEAPSAVKVTVKPKTPIAENSEAIPVTTLNHKGKTLKPIGDVTKLQKAETKTASSPKIGVARPVAKPKSKPKAVTNSVRITKKPISTKKPYEVVKATIDDKQEAPETDSKPVEEVRQPVVEKAAKHKKHTPHVARIFDTQTYHIPITVDHHHRRAALPLWGQISAVAVGLAAMVILGLVFGLVDL